MVQTSYSPFGTLSAVGEVVQFNIPGDVGEIGVQLSGTFSGTVVFEVTNDDGQTWSAISGPPLAGGAEVSEASAAGIWRFAATGLSRFRVRCTALASGAIEVHARQSTASGGVEPPSGGVASAVTIADGGDVSVGAKNDAAAGSDTGTFSLISLFKRALQKLTSIAASLAGTLTVSGRVDMAAGIAPLEHRYYISDGIAPANATVNGFFLDINGESVGDAFTATISTTVAKSWADIYADDLPAGAVGVNFDSDTNLRYWISDALAATAVAYAQTNKAKLPTLVLGKNITLGRVA